MSKLNDTTTPYDVVWETPSHDSSGSMPLGNGDIGLNVWVEADGDLLFYISKTDAWSGNTRLLKLGRARIHLTPNPFEKGLPFTHALRLATGELVIRAGAPDGETMLRVWVDANAPVVYVEAEGKHDFELQASLEVWREHDRELQEREVYSAYGMDGAPHPVVEEGDTVVPAQTDRVVWYHRNDTSAWLETMKLQGLEPAMATLTDPLLHRTFGGLMQGTGLVVDGDRTLRSAAPGTRFALSICLLTRQTETAQEWLSGVTALAEQAQARPLEQAREAHGQWWQEFWNRSYIHVTGGPMASQVSQGYALQRFIAACAGRGGSPIKFNGSIFTVDAREPDEVYDADYRRWGGTYWFQNTRLAYWPMLEAGDFEMMQPLFRTYMEALPLAKARTKLYFGHEGACYPETMHFWGAYANSNYGWDRTGKPVSQCDNTYIRHYWSGALELVTLMLDYYAFTCDQGFARDTLLPMAKEVLRFYDQHHPRDEQGKLHFHPAQSLETWQDVVNPSPEIAGLQYVLDRLAALPAELGAAQERESWRKLREAVPELPLGHDGPQAFVLPAADILGPIANCENPELYSVFPYRLFGVGKPDLEVGRLTFEKRRFRNAGGWQQDPIQAALLGLTEVAAEGVAGNFSHSHAGSRFPAFWGPNYDWIPDQDHGSVAMMGLQQMLLQADGDRILLLPAWPKDWDVEFKLHAPKGTTVEGVWRRGKLESVKVTPESRAKDVVQL